MVNTAEVSATDEVVAISPKSLAARWEVSVKLLSAWRTAGKGPRFFYANEDDRSSVRYPLAEIEAQEGRLHDHS